MIEPETFRGQSHTCFPALLFLGVPPLRQSAVLWCCAVRILALSVDMNVLRIWLLAISDVHSSLECFFTRKQRKHHSAIDKVNIALLLGAFFLENRKWCTYRVTET